MFIYTIYTCSWHQLMIAEDILLYLLAILFPNKKGFSKAIPQSTNFNRSRSLQNCGSGAKNPGHQNGKSWENHQLKYIPLKGGDMSCDVIC